MPWDIYLNNFTTELQLVPWQSLSDNLQWLRTVSLELNILYRYWAEWCVNVELVQHFFEITRWMMMRDQSPLLKTDHQPLKWLDSASKSHAHSQRLECWALELHAYEFGTMYIPTRHKTKLQTHSENLVTLNPPVSKADLSEAQKTDPVLKSMIDHLLLTDMPPPQTNGKPFPTGVLNNYAPNSVCMILCCVEK